MAVYNEVQTGANIQLGGRHDGFTSVVYHVLTSFRVINPPSMPPTWGKSVRPTAGTQEGIATTVGETRESVTDTKRSQYSHHSTLDNQLSQPFTVILHYTLYIEIQ